MVLILIGGSNVFMLEDDGGCRDWVWNRNIIQTHEGLTPDRKRGKFEDCFGVKGAFGNFRTVINTCICGINFYTTLRMLFLARVENVTNGQTDKHT